MSFVFHTGIKFLLSTNCSYLPIATKPIVPYGDLPFSITTVKRYEKHLPSIFWMYKILGDTMALIWMWENSLLTVMLSRYAVLKMNPTSRYYHSKALHSLPLNVWFHMIAFPFATLSWHFCEFLNWYLAFLYASNPKCFSHARCVYPPMLSWIICMDSILSNLSSHTIYFVFWSFSSMGIFFREASPCFISI